MQRPKGTILATVGAMVMTVVAGTAALAVNGGILQSTPDSGVGDLETVATVATVSVDPQDPNVRYITVFVDDPVAATSSGVADATPEEPVAFSEDSTDDDEYEGEHDEAEYDEDETHNEDEHEEDEEHDEDEEDEHDEEEHEGADDDD